MTVNYTVNAEVVDIRFDIPKLDMPRKDDIFLVDTNAWYWYSYSKSIEPKLKKKARQYTSYLKKALSAQSLLLYCGISLAELAHNIEQKEKEIYEKTFSSTLKPKEYRHNYSTERAKVIKEVQVVWSQVTSIAICTDILINEATANAALTRFKTQPLDGYDLLILEAMDKAGANQIITDDGDYVTVPGIKVFTANIGAIDAAQTQGKLLKR